VSDRARLYFRVIERSDGLWACRTGRQELDAHPNLGAAIEHMIGVAGEHRPSKVFIHHLDGRVVSETTLD
jgi:hypothetical protein